MNIINTRLIQRFLHSLTFAAIVACGAVVTAAPAHFWFSLSPENPYDFGVNAGGGGQPRQLVLSIRPGESRPVWLWARPQTADAGPVANRGDAGSAYEPANNPLRQLLHLSLDVASNSPDALASGFFFDSPGIRFDEVTDSHPENQRDIYDLELGDITLPYASSAGIDGIGAYSLNPGPGSGYGPVCNGCAGPPMAPAWKVGSLVVDGASLGETGFNLQIGQSGIVHADELYDADLDDEIPPVFLFHTLVEFGGSNVTYDAVLDRSKTLAEHVPDLIVHVSDSFVGDYNTDGVVDAADYTVWRDAAASGSPLVNRHPAVTGPAGDADYHAWRANYGRAVSASTSTEAPEPLGVLTACLLFVILLARRAPAVTLSHYLFSLVWLLPAVSIAQQPLYWTGASNSNWNNEDNWLRGDGQVPTPNVLLNARSFTFNYSSNASQLVRLNGNQNVNDLYFRSTGVVEIAPGGTPSSVLAIEEGGIDTTETAGRIDISSAVRIRRNQTWYRRGSNEINVSGDVALNSNLTVRGTGDTSFTSTSDISGAGTLIKEGAGTLTLGGNNTFTGGLNVNHGTLRVTSDSNLGAGAVVVDGAILKFIASTTVDNPITFLNTGGGINYVRTEGHSVTFTGPVVGGQWAKQGEGTLTLDGSNTGDFSVENGTVLVTSPSGWQGEANIFDEKQLWVATSSDWSLGSSLRGAGTLYKSGVGRLTLNSASGTTGFSGNFEIECGQLAMAPARYQNRPITTNRSSAEAVFLNGGSYSGAMDGTGRLIKEGSSTLTLLGANSYSGGTYVASGGLRGNTMSLQGGSSRSIFLAPGTALTLDQSSNSSFLPSIVDYNGGGTRTLTKINSGRLLLSGANTFTGNISVQGGTLAGDTTSIQQPVAVYPGAAVEFTFASGTRSFGESISGSGDLILDAGGKLILTGDTSELSGTTTLKSGALQIDTDFAPSSRIEFNGHAPTTLIIDQDSAGVFYNDIGDIFGNGARTLIKRGTGRVFFSGPRSFNGLLDIQEGTVAGNSTSLTNAGSATRVAGGAVLEFAGSGEVFYSNPISGNGSLLLTKSVNRRVHLDADNSYSGGTVVQEGIVRGATTTGAIQGDFDLQSPTSRLEINQNGDDTFSGNVTGAGSLWKFGSGELTVTSVNTYSGGTEIRGGSLDFLNQNAPGDVAIVAGAKLVLSGDNRTSGSQRIYSGNITGGGVLRKEGAATVSLTGDNDHSGGTEIAGGVLSADLGSLQGDVSFSNGGELWLTVTSGDSGSFTGDISGNGVLRKTAVGGGDLTLVGDNSYSGGTFVEAGKLIGDSSSLQGAINLSAGTVLRFDQSTNGSSNAAVSGSGKLVKQGAGNLTLGSAMSHTGGTEVLGGKLVVNTNSLQGSVLNNAEVIISQSSAGSYAGVMTGVGALRKIKVGHITLDGDNEYTGGTFIDAGTLSIDGSVDGNVVVAENATLGGSGTIGGNVSGPGRVAPGNSPGILTISGDYTQDADSVLEIEVGGYTYTPAPPLHDRLEVAGTATLAGRLEAPVIDPLKAAGGPTLGHSPIEFLTYGSRVGEFAEIVSPGLEEIDEDLTVDVDYGAGSATLRFVDKLYYDFDDDGNDGTPTWEEVVTWEDVTDPMNPVPAAVAPDNRHDVEIVNNAASAQTVAVVRPLERVARLKVGDGERGLSLVVGNGDGLGSAETLASVTSVNVVENGTLSLNDGVVAGIALNVDGGLLEGNGVVDLLGVEATLTDERTVSILDGAINPGLNTLGSEIGTLELKSNFAQGADGEFRVDITGDNSGGNNDFVQVDGSMSIDGTLTIDASNLADGDLTTLADYAIASAAGGISGRFDRIIVEGRNDIYFAVDYASASLVAQAEGDGVAESAAVATLTGDFRYKGDVVATTNSVNEVGQEDALVLAAILSYGPEIGNLICGEGCATGGLDLISAFDFVDTTPDDTQTVDYFDLPYFARAMSASQGIPIAEAYTRIDYAMAVVQRQMAVPEPSSTLLFAATLVLGLSPRRSRL